MNELTTGYILAAALLLGIGSLLPRALPFLALKGNTRHALVTYLGYWSPAAILSILVFYCIRPNLEASSHALPSILSVLLVMTLHHCYRKPLLSIVAGTAAYMLLSGTFSF